MFADMLFVLKFPLCSTPLKDVDENLFKTTKGFQVVNWYAYAPPALSV